MQLWKSVHFAYTTTVVSSRLTSLNDAIREKSCYDMFFVNDFCSLDPKKKYIYQYVHVPVCARFEDRSYSAIQSCTLPVWALTLETMFSSGRFLRVYHWKQQIKQSLPTYHSRALRRAFINRFGLVASGVKSHVLRQIMCVWLAYLCMENLLVYLYLLWVGM